jgi:hypothetical protein
MIDLMTILTGWQNFYVIVGSSAGALIGLQFVVMTLVASLPISRSDAHAGDAFTTPTVVHFGVVLLLAALGCVPWDGIDIIAGLWGVLGLAGAVYVVLVARRLRLQTVYRAVFEDWLFHVLLPFSAYATLGVATCIAFFSLGPALFVVGGAALLLLFIGIHNAWDIVRYHVFEKPKQKEDQPRR